MYRCEVPGCGKTTVAGKKLLTITVFKQGKPGFSPRKPETPIPRQEISKEIKACFSCKFENEEALRKKKEEDALAALAAKSMSAPTKEKGDRIQSR